MLTAPKKVLIVTDNVIQYERIKRLIATHRRPDVTFDFRHSSAKSPMWQHPDFENQTDKHIDVKKDYPFIVANYQLVISVHCLQLFPKELVEQVRCINIHPGYNPINRGWYPQVFAIIHDLPIGATIHEMDEELDHGPIIARAFVDMHSWDTSECIYNRVLEKEIALFEAHFNAILDHTYQTVVPEQGGNLFLKRDFNALCELDLQEVNSFESFLKRLRALTHGKYHNAFYTDVQTGEKVYVKIELTKEK